MFDILAAVKKLDEGLKEDQENLLEDICMNAERQISQYYAQVKVKIMAKFESELDALIKVSRENMKLQTSSNGKVFSLTGTMPSLGVK